MTSSSHEDDPRSLICYSFQRGSCIVFIIQLKLFRKNDKILNYIDLKWFFFLTDYSFHWTDPHLSLKYAAVD